MISVRANILNPEPDPNFYSASKHGTYIPDGNSDIDAHHQARMEQHMLFDLFMAFDWIGGIQSPILTFILYNLIMVVILQMVTHI